MGVAKDGFVHLHLHTNYSLLDGAIQQVPLFSQINALGMGAVAMTDHGNLFGCAEFHEKALAQGVRPILGCEAYIAANSRFDKERKPDEKSGFDSINHQLLLATNETGWKNLMKLSSLAYLEGFYYKPRIDLDLLREHSEGLITTSGCLSSLVCSAILGGNTTRAWELTEEFARIFDGRYYLEIQRHGIADQDRVNAEMLKMAEDLRLPLLATNDAHYLHDHDHEGHEALLCIGTGTTLDDPRRFKFDGSGFFVKSAEEMYDVFSDVPQALAASVEIAERCHVEIDTGNHYMPEFPVPLGRTPEDVLRASSWTGLRQRMGMEPDQPFDEKGAIYVDRMKYELDVICDMGFAGYFLIVGDFIDYARENGVPVGPGRGSSAGSLVTYSLGITGIDPVEYDIIFERFLNPERVSLPDVDVDFCMRGRDQVIRYVQDKYDGEGIAEKRVAQIITFGKLQAKAAIRDVGRVLGMAFGDVDRISKLVPDVLGIRLQEAIDASPDLRAARDADAKVAKLLTIALDLEGLTRHASTHAAGVVVGNRPLIDMVPLYRDPKSGDLVTQYDMNMVERVGLVKFDLLGLKTLTLIADAERLVRHDFDADFSIDDAPLDDKKAYDLICRGDTFGVFQIEGGGCTELAMRLQPRRFEDIIPLVGLYRPGPLEAGITEDYVLRKQGRSPVTYFLPEMESITKDSYGLVVYQDQVLQIANRISGYSLGEADLLRRAMGKKKPEEMAKQRERFVEGARANGVSEPKAVELFDMIEKFAGYAFPKAHSTAYALITFQTAYLKANYPLQFYSALLTIESGNHDKLATYLTWVRDRGIQVLPPEMNTSQRDFAVVGDNIRFGFAGVKNVGAGAIEAILEERERNGAFASLYDFATRIDSKRVNKRVVESLIRCGAFDFTKATRASLWESLVPAIEAGQRATRDREIGQGNLFGDTLVANEPALPEVPEWDRSYLLSGEKELLGFYVTGHPLESFATALDLFASFRLDQVPDVSAGRREVWVGGLLNSLRVQNTRKGDLMARATIEDLGGRLDCVFFPKTYARFSAFIQAETPVLCKAKLSGDTERVELHVDEVIPLEEAWNKRTGKLTLHLPQGLASRERLQRLRELLDLKPGSVPVGLEVMLEDGVCAVLDLPGHPVTLTEELIGHLNGLFGERVAHCQVL